MKTNSKTILLVDDNESMRKVLRTILEKRDYHIRDCENGQEAIATLSDWAPDLIILDLLMPVLGGFEFLAWRNQTLPSIPVLVLTAVRQQGGRNPILDAGATAVLTKPTAPAELLAEVARILAHPAPDANTNL